MNKALFLDRDGVINEDSGYVYEIENFHFLEGIFDFLKLARDKGYLLIVITNQAGIARGYYSKEDFDELTDWMLKRFRKQGIDIASVYYCPYHPDYGVGEYRQESFNRKPNPGMIFEACNAFNIDLKNSILIGDKDSDMQCGRCARIGKLMFLQGKYPLTPSDDIIICNDLKKASAYLP